MSISVIIPAYNEELYIADTIRAILTARDYLQARAECAVELLVVDNGSTDGTDRVARDLGAIILAESSHNIACVRNRGARAASGDVLVFIDADTWIPDGMLLRIHQLTSERECFGGAADTQFSPKRRSMAVYLGMWRIVGKLANLAQGPLQFCRKDVFCSIHGYDESLLMGEDVDFFSRLRRYAKLRQGHAKYILDLRVMPSARRFDQWPLWRTLLFTNPFVIGLFRRVPRAWTGWYKDAPR